MTLGIFGRMIMSSSSFTLFFVCYHFLTGLGMENIGGIFVVLICGLIVAIFMAMLEFLWTLRHSEATEVNLQRVMACSIGRRDKFTGLCTDKSHFSQILWNPTGRWRTHRTDPRAGDLVSASSPTTHAAIERALNFWVSDSSRTGVPNPLGRTPIRNWVRWKLKLSWIPTPPCPFHGNTGPWCQKRLGTAVLGNTPANEYVKKN